MASRKGEKMFRALRRLWGFATCTHWNTCRSIVFEDSTEINCCTRCGQVLWIMDEGSKLHNDHLMRDRLAL